MDGGNTPGFEQTKHLLWDLGSVATDVYKRDLSKQTEVAPEDNLVNFNSETVQKKPKDCNSILGNIIVNKIKHCHF